VTTARRFVLDVPVTLRACRRADLEKLEWFGAFTHHRALIREAFELQSRGEAVLLLAIVGGFPVGQAWLHLTRRPAPTIWAVRVLEPFQGAGLGARLLQALEDEAAARGCERLELAVEQSNERARAFYERLGWRVTGERAESYGYTLPDGRPVRHELCEWVMEKRLVQSASGAPTRA
jgi:ribosomal protein S18 acetylase RimI-like enzyme